MNRCRTCSATYPEAGDGWEGECGNCADKTYLAEERQRIEAAIADVRANMPWSDDRDDLLDDLYAELAEVTP